MHTFCEGNIFDSKMQTLVNPVNCVGVMGSGLAKEFKNRYPMMYLDYRERCKRHDVQLGYPYVFSVNENLNIVNFPTKEHWKNRSWAYSIDRGMWFLSEKYKEWGITSIALPALGCGLGGLDWKFSEEVILRYTPKMDIPIEIYLPLNQKL